MNRQGKGKIEYLDYTWSPISGCLHDCSYCYMKRMAARFPQVSMTPAFHENRLSEAYNKKPSIIGVSYSGDMWGKWVPEERIKRVLRYCEQAHWHKFLFLTKNPARYGEFDIPLNCWCGTSVTGGSEADHYFEDLRVVYLINNVIHNRRFLSLEPFTCFPHGGASVLAASWIANMSWLIVGGLSGKGAQGVHPSDMELIIEDCKDSEVPLFIKSNAGCPEKIQQYPEGLKL